ncbi:MAG: sensor domain-containing diguanylate cyclase [Planctomycetota bacterium]
MAKDLFETLKNAKRLPTPPGVALRVLHLAQQDDASLADIAEAISSDPAVAAKILKFVNSPLAGVGRKVSSLQQAISLLGLRSVKLIALSFSLASTGRQGICPRFDFDGFWSRSLARAVASRIIARLSGSHAPEEAFVAGLLSRLGQLALASGIPKQYGKVLGEAEDTSQPLCDVERRHIGVTHVDFGARLTADWQLPAELCNAIAEFGHLTRAPDDQATEPLARILHTADLTASVVGGTERQRGRASVELAECVRTFFGWDAHAWEPTFKQIVDHWREYGQILAVKTADVSSFADILTEAKECLVELGLAADVAARRGEARQDELLLRLTTDGLTALGNRAAFDERLELEANRAVRTKRPLALVMMDIDHFKRFNDTYGHQAGDAVLQMVANTVHNCVRDVDFAARYGGDELGVITPECDPARAVELGERLRRRVEAAHLIYEGQSLEVTVSVGVVVYGKPDGSRCPADLIRAADQLLYRAKKAGRNCVKSAVARRAGPKAPATATT